MVFLKTGLLTSVYSIMHSLEGSLEGGLEDGWSDTFLLPPSLKGVKQLSVLS